MKKIQHILFIVSLLTIAKTNIALAQKTWTGATSTNWATASNWSPSIVPTTSDNITIPNTANKPVFSTGTHTVSSNGLTIQSGASLTLTGGTFATSGSLISTIEEGAPILILAGGALNISGGTLNNNGAIRNNGTITYTSGTYSNGTDGYYYSQNMSGSCLFTGTTFTNTGVLGDFAFSTATKCSYFGSGLTSTGKFFFNLTNSNTPCTDYYQIVVTGTANLSGSNYEAWDINGDVTSGTTYTLLTATSITNFTNADVTLQNNTGKYVHIRQLGNTLTGLVNTSPTLAVELINFNAATEGSKNHLTWSTASETNNKGFDIERSRDGETFQSIGTVKAIGKAGNYNFTDAVPFATSYYRLKQVDFDGTETYSKVVSVANKGGKSLKVYPTLVSNGFLAVDTEGGDYSIYNIVGQQVQSGKTAQRLDVSALAKGTYFLKVGTEHAQFVKQ